MSNDFFESLKAEGELATRGEFSLDGDKAREKMERFQLVNPYYYILELVQAAHLIGATRISIEVDSDEVDVSFDGEGLTEEELSDVYSAAFSRDPDRLVQARRHFAIALTAIGAIEAAEVRLVMASARGRSQLVIDKNGERVEELGDQNGAPNGGLENRFYVKERFRFGHLMEFFEDAEELEEAKIVIERCRYSGIEIELNGEVVSKGHALDPGTTHVCDVTWGDERGVVGIRNKPFYAPGWRSTVALVQNGVLISQIQLEGRHVAVEAIFETSRLTKNLSQSAFVEDDAFAHLLESVLEDAIRASMTKWVEGLSVDSTHGFLRELARSVWEEVVETKASSESIAQGLATALERLPIWPIACQVEGADPVQFGSLQLMSYRDIVIGPPERPVAVSTRHFATVTRSVGVFLSTESSQGAMSALRAYSRRVWVDATEELARAEIVAKNKYRWRQRKWTSPQSELVSATGRDLPPATRPVSFSFTSGNYRVEIGRTHSSEGLQLVHVHKGHVLNSGRVPGRLPAARVVIEGEFEVDELFEAPLRTEALVAVYLDVIRRLPEIWIEFASRPGDIHDAESTSQLGVAALQVVTGTYLRFSLEAFGFSEALASELANHPEAPKYLRIGASDFTEKIGDRGARVAARLDALGPLGRVSMVPCYAEHASLEGLWESFESGGDVWTATLLEAHEYLGGNRWLRGPIVSDSYPWGYLVDATFEDSTDAVYHLVRDRAHRAFLYRPVFVVDRAIATERHLVHGEVRGPIAGGADGGADGGWRARWGLRDELERSGADLNVLYADRLLAMSSFDTIFALDIVVDGPGVEPNATVDGLKSDDFLADVEHAVVASARDALVELAGRLVDSEAEPLSGPECRLVWALASKGLDHSEPLSSSALVRDTHGDVLSAAQLRELGAAGAVHWVLAGHPVLEKIVAPGAAVIELPRIDVLIFLKRIVGGESRLVNCSSSEERQRVLEQARVRFYARSERSRVVPFAIATASVRHGDRTTIAGLIGEDIAKGEASTISTIAVCRDWREVAHRQFDTPYGRFRVIHDDPELRLDPEWIRPETSAPHAVGEAREACERVLVDYLGRVLESRDSQPHAIRTRVFGWLVQGWDRHDEWRESWNLLQSVSLFMGFDGRWRTMKDLRRLAESEVIYWVEKGQKPARVLPDLIVLQPEQIPFSRRVFGARLQRLEFSPAAAALGVSGTSTTLTGSTPPDIDEAAPTVPKVYEIEDREERELEREPSTTRPEDLVVAAVKELMRHCAQLANQRSGFLPATHIESLRIWGNDPKRAARITPDAVSIMGDHVATRYALEAPDDPIRQAFLASGVLTALNFHYEEIGDDDEQALQRALLERLNGSEQSL